MHLIFHNKRDEQEILLKTHPAELVVVSGRGARNKLIQGDNLAVMKSLLDEHRGKVDLVYIDPPFATNGCFRISDERANTVSSSGQDHVAYRDNLVGEEFLEFLRERLVFLRELMSEKASIYLHIDYKIGHYVKLLMDEVFGEKNFRNDITRIKCNPKNFNRKAYGNIKDLVLFYSKSENLLWNEIKIPFTEEDLVRLFGKIGETGRRYTTIPLHAPGETVNGKTGKEWRGMKPPKGRHWRSDPESFEEWDKQGLIEWSASGVPRKKIFADEKQGIVRIVTAMKRVESEFQPRRTELQQLQQKVNQLTEDINKTMTIAAPQEIQRKQDTLDQAKKDAQRKGEDAQTAYNKRMQEVMGPVYEDLGKALDTFAKARGVTLLLDVSKIGPAILNTPPEAMDVTRAFITEFNTKFPATASVTPPQ